MESDKLKYHRHLDAIAAMDVSLVKEKDKSYGASWKKRGGIFAFAMLARKWDRLEEILAMPQMQTRDGVSRTAARYDIFEAIAAEPAPGEDGTTLAEVRDLRRYLLLVEAEMVERGAVGEPVKFTEFEWKPTPPFIKFVKPGTPEDGGHHAQQDGGNGWDRLDDGLEFGEYAQAGIPCIPAGTNYGIVDRSRVKEELWEHLPRLHLELNNKEWEDLPPYYQMLYFWDKYSSKWMMGNMYREVWGKAA